MEKLWFSLRSLRGLSLLHFWEWCATHSNVTSHYFNNWALQFARAVFKSCVNALHLNHISHAVTQSTALASRTLITIKSYRLEKAFPIRKCQITDSCRGFQLSRQGKKLDQVYQLNRVLIEIYLQGQAPVNAYSTLCWQTTSSGLIYVLYCKFWIWTDEPSDIK